MRYTALILKDVSFKEAEAGSIVSFEFETGVLKEEHRCHYSACTFSGYYIDTKEEHFNKQASERKVRLLRIPKDCELVSFNGNNANSYNLVRCVDHDRRSPFIFYTVLNNASELGENVELSVIPKYDAKLKDVLENIKVISPGSRCTIIGTHPNLELTLQEIEVS